MKKILIFMLIYILAASAFFALPMNLADNTPVVKEKPITAAPVESKKFPLESKDVLAAMLWPLAILTGCPGSSTDPEPDPISNPGTNQTVTLSNTLSVTLNGAGSSGAGSYSWECVSYTANKGAVATPYTAGQITGMITNADKSVASVDLRKAGTYVFQLSINGDVSTAKEVTVVVNPMTDSRNLTTAASIFTPNSLTLAFIVPSFNNVGAMWAGFNANDVTWTLTCSLGKDLSTYAASKTAVPASAYVDTDMPTITQVFKYQGTTIGQRTIATQQLSGSFTAVVVDSAVANTVPTISLPVSQQITEL